MSLPYAIFSTYTKEQICQYILKTMDYFMAKRLFDVYGITTDFSALASDSIRYPPSASIPNGLVNTSKLKEKMSVDNAALTPKLENFTQMYQQMAASLLNISLDKLIPPGHPMYSKENSITLLKVEKEKILKENLELKKKLENKK
uniref:Uncharacterized protein n=1 Tax=uncultured marine thaumarchaeote KM3_64_C01 TaxID=1456221 RepID=A0A075HH90_9ARCH|nr:hypothetical protein [uncultured marine thaumarchaeote KM3_64_C01]